MNRSRWSSLAAVALASPLVVACATGGVTTGQEIQEEMNIAPYDGPPATIAVGPCQDKSGGSANFSLGDGDEQVQFSFTSEVGQGMADIFVTSLLNTNGRFRVLETGAVEALEREQGYQGPRAQGRMGGADLLLTCAVTSVEPDAGGIGTGFLNAIGSVVGAGGVLKQATVELNIRLVDVETREIVTAFRADGTATSAAAVSLFASGGSIGALGGYSNTPIEGAVQKAILRATEHLAEVTPQEYFGADQAVGEARAEGETP